MIGNLTTKEIEDVLHKNVIGRIGCQGDDKVYIVPMLYVYDGKYLYGHSREGQKVRMMRKNPNICFEIDEMKDLGNWRSVVIHGQFEEILGRKNTQEVMRLIERKMEPQLEETMRVSAEGMVDFHQRQQSGINTVFFRIKVKEKTGKFERQK